MTEHYTEADVVCPIGMSDHNVVLCSPKPFNKLHQQETKKICITRAYDTNKTNHTSRKPSRLYHGKISTPCQHVNKWHVTFTRLYINFWWTLPANGGKRQKKLLGQSSKKTSLQAMANLHTNGDIKELANQKEISIWISQPRSLSSTPIQF